MSPKLILVYGAGSGLGKSTVSRFVCDLLQARGIKTRCVREEESLELEAFAPYIRQVEAGNGADCETLLTACNAFIDACAASDEVWVADSILPCWDWLVTAGCTADAVDRFNARLNRSLAKFRPLCVYLTGDTRLALQRAIDNRGSTWARSLALERCDSEAPERLLDYFAKLRECSDRLLETWPYDCMRLDTTLTARSDCEAELRRRLDKIL